MSRIFCMVGCFVILVFAVVTARCQAPSAYLAGSFNLMPAGYASVAWGGGGGVTYNARHVVFDSYAGYDNGHKDNDATSRNNKGHDRFLRGFEAYQFGSTYLGVGARWSQLSTTNYVKGGPISSSSSWHPEVGVGHDFAAHDKFYLLSMRGQVLYMFRESRESVHYPDGSSCAGCGNGSQGLDISLWFPSPAKPHSHLFMRINVVPFIFHDTITDPTNVYLTRLQTRNRHLTDSTEFLLGVKF